MDDFFKKLKKLSSKEDLVEAIETGRHQLGQVEGATKLDFAWELLKGAERRYHLRKYAEEIINDVLELAQETSTEQAALLLVRKAYYAYRNFDAPEATRYANLALKKSRDIGSNKAESESLIVKAFLSEDKLEHKKASAWYTMALAKCTKLQRPGLMLKLGTSLRRQGEYSQAWSLINQAQSLASDLSNDLSLDDNERMKCKRTVLEAFVQLGIVHEDLGDIDGAFHAYNKGLSLNKDGKLKSDNFIGTAEVIVTPVSETEAPQPKAGKTLYEGRGNYSIISYYQEYGRLRSLMTAKQYEDALRVSRKVLFEGTIDSQNDFRQLNHFMDNHTDKFIEIVHGIAVCLHATGRIVESESISKAVALYSELKQQTGRYNEKNRDYTLRVQENSLCVALRQILLKIPDLVEYKNIQAQYYKDKGRDRVIFKIGKKEIIKRSRRYFLVFKCLVDNAGEKVSGKDLDEFVINQGVAINEQDSGLRVYVDRLKKDINLAQFLVPHEGKGWKLQDP
jgi:tetratricopeptide (TPR) repeat protein